MVVFRRKLYDARVTELVRVDMPDWIRALAASHPFGAGDRRGTASLIDAVDGTFYGGRAVPVPCCRPGSKPPVARSPPMTCGPPRTMRSARRSGCRRISGCARSPTESSGEPPGTWTSYTIADIQKADQNLRSVFHNEAGDIEFTPAGVRVTG
jgi:hypothetical protein